MLSEVTLADHLFNSLVAREVVFEPGFSFKNIYFLRSFKFLGQNLQYFFLKTTISCLATLFW
ncbi:Slc9a7 protein [Microscilla marina ATCC 23134]|uniref:Slc9a7 protein n=1 Tax=Microscilla marina ATCC 23134 TaxID=313606 RepID=A1ZXF3_MICM2|nr:Slc9a7 protein [Microscilla marina ATCC 23134]